MSIGRGTIGTNSKVNTLKIRANKNLGQNFLFDYYVLSEIASYGDLSSEDFVLEIGPGLGTLTTRLCHLAGNVKAVEFDSRLANMLQENVDSLSLDLFGKIPDNLDIQEANILDFNISELPKDYKVIANIPYNLTSKIIEKFIKTSNRPSRIVFLLQKEVSERLAAKAGKLSTIAIFAQLFYDIELGIKVPASMFTPEPKVDSRVLIMKRRSLPIIKESEVENFMTLVKAGFSERRKKLRTSLAVGLRTNKEIAEKLLLAAGIDPNNRAQELSIDDWIKLSMVKLSK